MLKSTTQWVAILALAAIFVFVGCSGDKGSNNSGGGGNNAFSFNKSVAGGGGTAQVTFTKAGSFAYHCTPHPQMTHATISVTATGTATTLNVSIANFTLPNATVPVNSTVIWTNNDAQSHTVTSD